MSLLIPKLFCTRGEGWGGERDSPPPLPLSPSFCTGTKCIYFVLVREGNPQWSELRVLNVQHQNSSRIFFMKDSRNLRVYTQILFYCLGASGDILYAKLLKEEILQCDKELLKAAKKAGSIGGKT